MAEQADFKGIVRFAGADIDGRLALERGLRRVYGINFMLANAICSVSNIDGKKQIGDLNEEELRKVTEVIKNPREYNIPSWLLNRRKDYESGEDKHLVFSDLKLQKDFDVRRFKKIKSYKGIRHALGLPLRGQRTRSNFRHGKTVGVRKKGIKIAKEAPKEAKK